MVQSVDQEGIDEDGEAAGVPAGLGGGEPAEEDLDDVPADDVGSGQHPRGRYLRHSWHGGIQRRRTRNHPLISIRCSGFPPGRVFLRRVWLPRSQVRLCLHLYLHQYRRAQWIHTRMDHDHAIRHR